MYCYPGPQSRHQTTLSLPSKSLPLRLITTTLMRAPGPSPSRRHEPWLPTPKATLTQQPELGQPAKPWGSQGQAAPAHWAIQSQSRQRRQAWQAANPRQAARGPERKRAEGRREGRAG